MIIYNVTVKVENDIAADWLQWMREVHIPDVMKSGFFSAYRLSRVISLRDTDGVTYSVQYDCASTAELHKYETTAAAALRKEHTERYAGKFVAFRSIMEVTEQG